MTEQNPFAGDHFVGVQKGGTLGLDPLTIVEWANFIALAAVSGVIGNSVFQFLDQWRGRRGKAGVTQLKEEVHKALILVKKKPHVSHADLKRRVDEIFAKHETLWK